MDFYLNPGGISMQVRDIITIKNKNVNITFNGDGIASHYFLLMVYGMKSEEAYEMASN